MKAMIIVLLATVLSAQSAPGHNSSQLPLTSDMKRLACQLIRVKRTVDVVGVGEVYRSMIASRVVSVRSMRPDSSVSWSVVGKSPDWRLRLARGG